MLYEDRKIYIKLYACCLGGTLRQKNILMFSCDLQGVNNGIQ